MGKGGLFDRIDVRCPACRGKLQESDRENRIVCSSCRADFPREGRLIDLAPVERTARNFPGLAMESPLIVSIYESCLWRRNPVLAFFMGITFDREYDIASASLRLRGDDAVLDLACGTGIYGRRVAEGLPEGMVVGIDLSLPMLSYARRRFCEEGLENYLLIHGDAVKIPLPDESMDAAICGGALHLFPDPEAAVLEVCRVLKGGGRFTVSVFSPGKGVFFESISLMIHMMEGIMGISSGELEGMFSRAGFKDIVCHHDKALWLIMSGMKK